MKIIDVGQEAHGFIAIGQMATGFIALGQIATGVIAIGQAARGFVAIGQVSIGLVTIGMGSTGVFWSAAMLGVAGRGAGIVLPYVPSGRKALDPPQTVSASAALDSDAPTWCKARLVREQDDICSLIADTGDLGVKLSARLRKAADRATVHGPVDVYALLESPSHSQGSRVCTSLMVDPIDKPNPIKPLLMLPVRLAVGVAVCVAVAQFALRPALEGLGMSLMASPF